MTGCRIGKVKLKNGAEVLRFPSPPRDETQKDLMGWAAHFAQQFKPGEMHGFILIAWSGKTSNSVVYNPVSDAVNMSTAPAFAEEETRRAILRQGGLL